MIQNDSLTSQLYKKMIGVNASTTMGTLNSIQLFTLDEAFLAGACSVGSLFSMTKVLLVGGNVAKIGSSGNVQLRKKDDVHLPAMRGLKYGKTVGELVCSRFFAPLFILLQLKLTALIPEGIANWSIPIYRILMVCLRTPWLTRI